MFSREPPRWPGLEHLALSGEAEGLGLVQPGAETSLEGPDSSPPARMERSARRQCQDLHSTAHWEDKRQGAEVETRGSGWI